MGEHIAVEELPENWAAAGQTWQRLAMPVLPSTLVANQSYAGQRGH